MFIVRDLTPLSHNCLMLESKEMQGYIVSALWGNAVCQQCEQTHEMNVEWVQRKWGVSFKEKYSCSGREGKDRRKLDTSEAKMNLVKQAYRAEQKWWSETLIEGNVSLQRRTAEELQLQRKFIFLNCVQSICLIWSLQGLAFLVLAGWPQEVVHPPFPCPLGHQKETRSP